MLENKAGILFESKNALEKALVCAQQKKTSLVVKKTNDKVWVVDFLLKVRVHESIESFIHTYSVNKILATPGNAPTSLGSLILAAGTLKEAIKEIRLAQWTASKLCLTEISDYLADIQISLQMVSRAILESRKTPIKKTSSVHPFCSLCWRLKNEYAQLNYSEGENSSTRYCLEHHSTYNYQQYNVAKGALIAAAKNRNSILDQELLIIINEKSINLKPTEHLLYQLSMSFADKPATKDLQKLKKDVLKWQDRATQVLELIKNNYPITSKLINNVKPAEYPSWGDWFIEIIKSLDSSLADHESWKIAQSAENAEIAKNSKNAKNSTCNNSQKTSEPPLYDNSLTGWPVLKTICHRHEAFKIVHMKNRPRGPKKGVVKKNTNLRSQLTKAVQLRAQEKKKIVWSHIAKELKVSPQRIHVLAKEMGLK